MCSKYLTFSNAHSVLTAFLHVDFLRESITSMTRYAIRIPDELTTQNNEIRMSSQRKGRSMMARLFIYIQRNSFVVTSSKGGGVEIKRNWLRPLVTNNWTQNWLKRKVFKLNLQSFCCHFIVHPLFGNKRRNSNQKECFNEFAFEEKRTKRSAWKSKKKSDWKRVSKMDPFPTTQRMLTWYYLYQDRSSTWCQKLTYIAFSLFNITFVAAHVAASVVFATKFVSVDLERSLYAIYQFFCWSPLIYMFIAAFQSRREITALIGELSLIYDASMYIRFSLSFK